EIKSGIALTVGSFGTLADLTASSPDQIRSSCDLVEIRLDLILNQHGSVEPESWTDLHDFPILFTARRAEEGGSGALDAAQRSALLMSILDRADCIDIEVASIPEMRPVVKKAAHNRIPWVASFHNFEKLPPNAALEHAAKQARDAGASAFKIAAKLNSPTDLARLAEFQLTDRGIPVASMGMGPLAPVSRLLCAQCGSVLNYGFLGSSPTAPGQWNARQLKEAIDNLAPFPAGPA
ncbi:MAG: type I 3-dehydroquinate dehydratase, partial [Verrucomicrobiales bacterium]